MSAKRKPPVIYVWQRWVAGAVTAAFWLYCLAHLPAFN